MTRPGALLRVDNISAGYGASDIIRGASLEAPSRHVTTIAGPNGAGKSTLMKVIVGLLQPRQGRILLGEHDITRLDSPSRASAGLGYVPQEHNVFKNLSVAENLQIGHEFIKRRSSAAAFRSARDDVLSLFPDLANRLGDVAGTLSGGQRQMLAIGCALMPGPSALLLDEPSAGLSPRYVGEMLDAVRKVSATGVTILMIEQNLVEAVRISDEIVLLVGGECRGRWPADRFLGDPDVRALFLGGVRPVADAMPDHGGSRGASSA